MKNIKSFIISNQNSIAIFVLIITTVLWGTTFIITKTITQDIPVLFYLGIRYTIALICFLPFLINYKGFNKNVLIYGSLTGVVYFLAIIFQTYGLQTTTAGKAGFITGLNAIIVPIISWFGFKKKPKKKIWIAIILSIIGMGLLFLESTMLFLIGDLLVLACAFMCALFIIMNDKYVQSIDVYLYSIVQLIVITILSFCGSLIAGEK